MSRPYAGLAPVRMTLDNGLVLLAKQTTTTPAVTISLAIRAGSIADPADAPGETYLLSRTIDRGTTTRSAADISEELDNRGIALTIAVTRHVFSIVATCLVEDFDAVFGLLGDVVMSPTLPESEIATRKREVITAIRQDEDNPAVRASETLMARLYPDHPYGRPLKGTVALVESMTRARMARLHALRFAPSELVAVVVGDVAVSRAGDAAGRVFGGWRTPPPAPIDVPHARAAVERRRLVVPMMNKAQTDIAYGFTTIARKDPAYYAYWLMNNALGQYGIGGRLGDSIRERQGMAYYVSSAFDANVVEGPLVVRAGVSPKNVDRAIASIDEELVRMTSEGLTEQEFAESRQYLIGSMPRRLETNDGIAQFLQTVEFFDLGLDYDVRVPALLSAVTRDDALAAARHVLDPARATIVVAGPYVEMIRTRAVFFDVDFTLITPGPMFRGEGYRAFCARYGMSVDAARFDEAVVDAAPLLDGPDDAPYDAEIFVAYTRRIIEVMGGRGDRIDDCAREIYAEWAACQHFDLYDEVPAALRALAAAGLRIGLISNSHRCLASFQSHFELQGLISATVSSSEHGLMKPHPSIFAAALALVDVPASAAVMVGDSVRQDVEGALNAGLRAVLLHRGDAEHPRAQELSARGVPTVRSLTELTALLIE